MKEKLLKNLKAKGVDTTIVDNNLFITYHVTETLTWKEQFPIEETTEDTINKAIDILNNIPEKLLAKVTTLTTTNYRGFFFLNENPLFMVIIDYFKLDNILITMSKTYLTCTIDGFTIHNCNQEDKDNMVVKKSIVSTKETFKEDLENLLEEFNQL